MTTYNELRNINVNAHTEKKGKFTYLSWAWAVDQLLQLDPTATWEYKFFDNKDAGSVPYCQIGDTAMVFCTVNAFGKSMTAQLPAINSSNKAIQNPNAMEINTAMQRCLAKAIALHGLSLYIYAGEDLPDDDKAAQAKPVTEKPLDVNEALKAMRGAPDITTLKKYHESAVKRAIGDDVFALDAAYEVAKEVLEASK